MEQDVSILRPDEPARFNPDRLERLCNEIGEVRAEHEVASALQTISTHLMDMRRIHPVQASGDLLVNAYFITYGLPITISRGANNIGPYQYPEKAVPLFSTNALNDQPLPVYGDGQQRRDYQHVLDHCQAIDLILHEGAIGETYNIGTGTEMTNLEMIGILLDELGKPRSLIRHVEDRLGHDRRYCLDVQKIMALGWEPDYTHEEAIRATVRWYVNNPQWWEPIRNGEFKEYYQRVYGNRKVLA